MITRKSYFYTSKKFLGFVLSFDCDIPQGYGYTFLLIEIKLFFVGFWITFNKDKK